MSSLIERIESLRREGEEMCKSQPSLSSLSFIINDVETPEMIEEAAKHFHREDHFEFDRNGFCVLYVSFYADTPNVQIINIHVRSKDKFIVKTEYVKQ